MIFDCGTVINQKYCILEELGHGGNGRVFLAKDLILEKNWAIKFFANSKKTEDEIRILKQVEHPMIPRIVEYIEYQQYTGVVMDYLKGVNLSAICQNGQLLSVQQTLKLGIDLCSVLMYLHEQNPPIIYRDLKPQNLMLTLDGQVKLIDFDCACFQTLDKTGEFAGTKGYAAPEQYEGIADPRVDIYALGVTLETICTPRKGFYVRKILKKCRKKKSQQRYASIRKLEQELQRSLTLLSDRSRNWKRMIMAAGILLFLPIIQLIVLTGSEAACLEAVKEERFEDAAVIFPEREEIYLAMLQKGVEDGKTQETISTIELLQKMYPEETQKHDGIRKSIGRLYLQGNPLDETFSADYTRAKYWYESVVESDDQEVIWSLNLLEILTVTGGRISWEEAAKTMKELETTSQNDEAAFEMLASVWMTNRYYFSQIGETPITESIRLLELCENENSLSHQILLAQTYYLDGLLGGKDESLRKSLNLYQKLSEEKSISIMMQNRCLLKNAYLHEELGQYENAAKIYQRLIKDNPKELEYICSYALMELIYCKDSDKAIELFRKASEIPGAKNNQNYQILKERLEGIE